MAEKNKKPIYKLHIDHNEDHTSAKDEPVRINIEDKPNSLKKKSSFKDNLKEGFRFTLVTLIVMGIAFLVMNPVYVTTVIPNEINKILGIEQESALNQLVEDNHSSADTDLLAENTASDAILNEIPDLNLEVAPPDFRIVIPRINKNVPIVPVPKDNLIKRDWAALENDIQEALEGGVIHYPGTAYPGEGDNVVVSGHSSYYPWNPGRFKDVFALLHDIALGDRMVVYKDSVKYVYEAKEIKVVQPEEVDVLGRTNEEQLTLITCTPIGTNLKRLIVLGELVEKVH